MCKLVDNKVLETKAIDTVCTKQSEVPAAECEAMLTKVWDTVAKAECASSTVAALPPMVCQLVENASLEKKAVDFVCSQQKEVPATECEAALTKIWGFLAQKECSSSTVASLPPTMCKLVDNKVLETRAIDAVCTKQSKVPSAECEAVLTKIWDTLASKECNIETPTTTAGTIIVV